MMDDAQLMDYLQGRLGDQQSQVLLAQCADDPQLAARLEALQQALLMVADAHSQAPSQKLRQRIRDSIAEPDQFVGMVDRAAEFLDLPAEQVRELFSQLAADELSFNVPVPGLEWASIPLGPRREGCEGSLIRMAAGGGIPRHGHHGVEWGLVLRGQLVDDLGTDACTGDYVRGGAEIVHRVWNPGSQTCVVLSIVEGGHNWSPTSDTDAS